MSVTTKLAEAIVALTAAEDEVVSIANTIKQVRHDHAVAVAGLEELLAQAEGDLPAAQADAIEAAVEFAHSMETQV
jgi:hypothetical protein